MSDKAYEQFLAQKRIVDLPTGIEKPGPVKKCAFPFQADVIRWALRRGRAALFEDCGLGKGIQQMEILRQVSAHTKKPTLLIMPLAVSHQIQMEAEKFGYDVTIAADDKDVRKGINVTNYEKLHKFDCGRFEGVSVDESSILKSYDGAFRNMLVESFAKTRFRYAATATPAPNDYMELGNHAEFLGVMKRSEMLSTFFVHDGGQTSQWRLKGHAESEFWRWMCSWAVNIRKPSDLGYDDGDFKLPPYELHQITVESGPTDGYLISLPASSLQERRQARRSSLDDRVKAAAILANGNKEQWLVWCGLNDEGNALADAIDGAVEVTGSDSDEHKINSVRDFIAGKIRVLVSKGSIFGWGMNLQNCWNVIACGLSDSYEEWYQEFRRSYRFGQKHKVNGYIITSRNEGAVVANIKRKERDAQRLADSMVAHMASISSAAIKGTVRTDASYNPKIKMQIPKWL